MTAKLLFEIAFWIVITGCGIWLIVELIPGHVKKYWSYIRQNKKDHKKGWRNRKWIWSFRNGRSL